MRAPLSAARTAPCITNDCPVGAQARGCARGVWAKFSSAAAAAGLVLGIFGGRARADLAVDGKKPTCKKPVAQPRSAGDGRRGGAVADPPPEKLMGKIAMPPSTPKKPKTPPQPVMGEPRRPMMGDIAVAEPVTPKTTK